ncbi:MAG: hypothetical protein CMC65_09765 [Flavobacteriaceae bacterium]|nr:hypothetical protein [Flavobacteriaceae bacterium]
MKEKIITLMFLSFSFFAYSQTEDYCSTPEKTNPDPIGVYSRSIDVATLADFNTKTFNIFF